MGIFKKIRKTVTKTVDKVTQDINNAINPFYKYGGDGDDKIFSYSGVSNL
ncbi:MAG: hypothetical protein WCO29_09850 [Nostocales cyanobacterium ELA583]|jgi:hypothetical protein